MNDLGTLGGDNSAAFWLNEAGEVAGVSDLRDGQTHHPVIWKRGKIEDLGTVEDDPCGVALSLNARGQVVGGTSDCNYFLHAFLWEKDGPMLDLNTLFPPGSGLQVTFAIDINDRGEILAKAIPPGVSPYQDPDLYGHLVVLVPCEVETAESCEASFASPSAAVPLARSTVVGTPNAYPKWSTRPGMRRIDLYRRFGAYGTFDLVGATIGTASGGTDAIPSSCVRGNGMANDLLDGAGTGVAAHLHSHWACLLWSRANPLLRCPFSPSFVLQ